MQQALVGYATNPESTDVATLSNMAAVLAALQALIVGMR